MTHVEQEGNKNGRRRMRMEGRRRKKENVKEKDPSTDSKSLVELYIFIFFGKKCSRLLFTEKKILSCAWVPLSLSEAYRFYFSHLHLGLVCYLSFVFLNIGAIKEWIFVPYHYWFVQNFGNGTIQISNCPIPMAYGMVPVMIFITNYISYYTEIIIYILFFLLAKYQLPIYTELYQTTKITIINTNYQCQPHYQSNCIN